jgi:hypothetical protein
MEKSKEQTCETCDFFSIFDHLSDGPPARICVDYCCYWVDKEDDAHDCEAWEERG